MKVAVIHEWLISYAGSEKVLEEILRLFPTADLFCVVDFLDEKYRGFLKNRRVKTTFIQNLPFAKNKYQTYLPLMPIAIEQLDLSAYDVIISSSHAVAKGVITGPNQVHFSYVHTPIRYAWDLQHQYLKDNKISGIRTILVRWFLHKIRGWDYRTSNGVDFFIANSNFIRKRIWKVYRRDAQVIYPPVDIDSFSYFESKQDFYLTVSRLVSYKKVNLIIEAFNLMPEKKLIVIGDGPELKNLKAIAGDNIQLMGYQPLETVKAHMQTAKAFIYAAEEDFGIAPVEAQACGTPVIAYNKGGTSETVVDIRTHTEPTGILFEHQSIDELIRAVEKFEFEGHLILPQNCRKHAVKFSTERFGKEFLEFFNQRMTEFV